MGRDTIIFLLLAAVAAWQVVTGEIKACKDGTKPDWPLYNMYKLTIHSRSAYCELNPCDKLPKGQNYPHPPLTLKTLSILNTSGRLAPTSCMPITYNPSTVRETVANLPLFWPSFDPKVTDDALWEKEAKEYGSCIVCQNRQQIANVTEYIRRAILEYKKVFGDNLNKLNLMQNYSQPVSLKALNDTLEGTLLEGKASFHCEGQRNNTDILQEVRICLHPDFTPWRCPPAERGTCTTPEVWFLGNLTSAAGLMNANAMAVMFTALGAWFVSKAY